ncbi:MAG: SDR family NAD(P)-dependent oxidoreductase [Planctomycetes bacterium]|nr:SDR family NAD(P)-dependent oxidoreductase [Planctomycetota bacterium]
MAKRQISGSRAIVTGASSGIGRELARQLAAEGADVVLVARRRERLEQLAADIGSGGPKVEIVAGDLTDPAVRRAAIETARTKLGGLDILVNNAGVGAMGRFKDADPDRVRRVMEVNFFALVEMTRLALPLLGEGNDPVIVNVSSILGHRGIPQMSEYSASKFAVQGFSESLRAELAAGPIGLLVVSPGTTETEFFDSVVQKTGEPAFPEHRAVPPAKVARETLRAIRSRRHEITPYFWGKVLCWLNRLSPRLMDWYLARFG